MAAIVDETHPPISHVIMTGLAKALLCSWAEQERRIGLPQ